MPGNFVVFTLNKEQYAIDILKAKEIMRMKGVIINKVPKIPKFISGIINLRGDAIPIISLKIRFGLSAENIEENRIIIVEYLNLIIGFLADSIVEVLYIKDEEIMPPPEDVKLKCEYVDSIMCKEKRLIFILNISKIIELRTEREKCSNLI